MAMLAQQMQLANAMMPGAPLQPVVRALPSGAGAEGRQHRLPHQEMPQSSAVGQEPAALKCPSVCLCVV